jgi:hypothetical protein
MPSPPLLCLQPPLRWRGTCCVTQQLVQTGQVCCMHCRGCNMPSPPLLDRRCAHIAAHQPERVGIPPGNGSVSVLRPFSPSSLCTRACAPPSEPSGMHSSYMNTEGVGMSGRDESMQCAHDYQYRTARHLAQLRSGAPVLAAVFLHTMVCGCVWCMWCA